MRSFFKAVAVTAAIAISAAPAQAQLTSVDPTCTLSTFSITPTDCLGAFSGNVDNQLTDVQNAITLEGWLTNIVNVGSSVDPNAGPFTVHPQTTDGVLNFDSAINGDFVLALKAGNSFSLFYFTGVSNLTSLEFTTNGAGTNGDVVNELSHAYLFTGDETTTTINTVPEPSTYALMASGLLAMGFAARRRRRA